MSINNVVLYWFIELQSVTFVEICGYYEAQKLFILCVCVHVAVYFMFVCTCSCLSYVCVYM